jgi:hypothetical protein
LRSTAAEGELRFFQFGVFVSNGAASDLCDLKLVSRPREHLAPKLVLAQACSPGDTTEHKRAEEERQVLSHNLQESKARLEEAQRVAHIGHYYWDPHRESRDLVRRALSHLWVDSAGRSH